ncbi:immunoglobulin kappa light chain-like [Archocentrus centrarchus]|uniref:immunoglobulin kappa light chain-like n=1 Tax=Archocentrus centrarchus TaxID=63155 RepID=UPI0011EA44B9|nr:immunoglobulin kappa light chain-like [Archocentrus centrarchus]
MLLTVCEAGGRGSEHPAQGGDRGRHHQMEHWLWIILAALFFECKGEDKVMQPAGDVTAAEGDTVTLGCTYETTASYSYLFWYKQEAKDFPNYVLQRGTTGTADNAPKFPKDKFNAELNKTSVPLKIQKLQLSDSAVYYCALRPTALTFGNPIRLTIKPKDPPKVSPTLFVLTPLQPLPADKLGPEVCLATDFYPKEGEMIMNVKGGPVSVNISNAVLSPKTKTYYFIGFSNETIHSCELQRVSSSNEADDHCTSIYPEKAKLNFYLLVMNGVRVLFTKTLAFNTILTIRGLIF